MTQSFHWHNLFIKNYAKIAFGGGTRGTANAKAQTDFPQIFWNVRL